jgi:flagellar motor switch/type III secretory pathway protein FliN
VSPAKPKDEKDPKQRYAGFEAVPIPIRVVIGSARCSVRRLTGLASGDVVVLDRAIGAPFALQSGDTFLGRVEPVATDHGISVKLLPAGEEDE